MKIEFKEEQQFTQWWLWVLLIAIGAFPVFGLYQQLVLGQKFGDKPMSDFGLIVFTVFVIGIIAMLRFATLKTEIDAYQFRITFSPFTKRKVQWQEVESAKIIKYGFVGWGIRLWTPYGTVYNTSGNMGLAIKLKNGKRFLVGTQKAKELEEIVKNILPDNN